MRRFGSGIRRAAALAVVPLTLLGSGALVWQASHAAFSANTVSGSNSWATGTVAVTNDQAGVAVFNGLTGLKPDSSATSLTLPGTGAYSASTPASGGSACIKVTYTGSLAANIRLYGEVTNAGLAQHLLFSVDTGTDTAPGADLSCATYTNAANVSGPSPNSSVYLSAFPATWLAANPTAWTGVAQNATRWYRISWALPADTALTGTSSVNAQVVFTWEAQNT
ncbi:MAG TPA: hypothetical protein VK453_18445 [Micromonosporaceae bacterium]|nr:hypothetical protein [Micromonosporaceae bacterium]